MRTPPDCARTRKSADCRFVVFSLFLELVNTDIQIQNDVPFKIESSDLQTGRRPAPAKKTHTSRPIKIGPCQMEENVVVVVVV